MTFEKLKGQGMGFFLTWKLFCDRGFDSKMCYKFNRFNEFSQREVSLNPSIFIVRNCSGYQRTSFFLLMKFDNFKLASVELLREL